MDRKYGPKIRISDKTNKAIENYNKVNNTNIPKQEFRSTSEYHYEFGNVTDEDVEMPDLEEYEWEEYDWQKEVDRLVEEHQKQQ